jgi:hypothetical protein
MMDKVKAAWLSFILHPYFGAGASTASIIISELARLRLKVNRQCLQKHRSN